MPIEDILGRIHDDVVEWDESREMRAFNRIRSELDRSRALKITRSRILIAALAGICTLILIGFLVF